MDVEHLLLWRLLIHLTLGSPVIVFSAEEKVCGCPEVHAAYLLVAMG